MTQRYECSLVLAAHGSVAAPDSNQPLFDLANRIEGDEFFSKVTPAFLHGEPNLTNVYSQLPPGDVVMVPVMTSSGYYLNSVIPGKLAENEGVENYRTFTSGVLGMHPAIPDLILNRIDAVMSLFQMTESDTTVVIVGHGTRRNSKSGQSTLDLVGQLRACLPNLACEVAFLDQDPEAQVVAKAVKTPHTLVVPFLISRGPHTTVDIPEAFGLPGGPDVRFPINVNRDGRLCVCDLPVGMYPEMSELVLELACDQLLAGKLLNSTN